MGLERINTNGTVSKPLETYFSTVTAVFLFVLNVVGVGLNHSEDGFAGLAILNIVSCISYLVIRFDRLTHYAQTPYTAMQDTIEDVHHMIQQVLHAYFEQHQMEYQLAIAQTSLARFHQEHQHILEATHSEVTQQYRNILAYAHYLEERVVARRDDASLREDYDEVCEQAFNLQLVVQAIGMLPVAHPTTPRMESLALSDRMASILLDLTPSLDRRAMKLTSAEWDETICVHSNSEWLTHTLWMMLLGCIRFAEDESTLTLRCSRECDTAVLEIMVSFLSPGRLSETERYHYLEQRCQDSGRDAHMFASTLEGHANVQLGKLLAARLGAALTVTPVHSHCCALTLTLPCA
jgi:hypothetical protein